MTSAIGSAPSMPFFEYANSIQASNDPIVDCNWDDDEDNGGTVTTSGN